MVRPGYRPQEGLHLGHGVRHHLQRQADRVGGACRLQQGSVHGRGGRVTVNGNRRRHRCVTAKLDRGCAAHRIAHRHRFRDVELSLVGTGHLVLGQDPVEAIGHQFQIGRVSGAAVQDRRADHHETVGGKAQEQHRKLRGLHADSRPKMMGACRKPPSPKVFRRSTVCIPAGPTFRSVAVTDQRRSSRWWAATGSRRLPWSCFRRCRLGPRRRFPQRHQCHRVPRAAARGPTARAAGGPCGARHSGLAARGSGCTPARAAAAASPARSP